MSELTLMVETILDTMQALEHAYHATEELRKNSNHAAFDSFKIRMRELEERLEKLRIVLDNEEAFAMDELMDALSRVYTGHRADYRRTPRMVPE